MKLSHIYFPFILLAFIIVGCSDDFFSVTKEIDLQDYDQETAIVARFVNNYEDDSEFFERKTYRVLLTKTKSIADTTQGFVVIDNAEVSLSYESGPSIPYTFVDRRGYYVPTEPIELLPNRELTLKVVEPNNNTIYTTITTPNPPEVNNLTVIPNSQERDNGAILDKVQLTIEDPPGENYYLIESTYYIKAQHNQDTFYTIDNGYIYSYNSLFADHGEVFTDEIFDNTTYTMDFWSERFSNRADFISVEHLRIDVWSLSKEEYSHRRSLKQNEDANENPFSEPSLVYSNIDGGQGIFSISHVDRYIYEF